jgi:hypothetical protein
MGGTFFFQSRLTTRKFTGRSKMWVEALCIDQQNLQERPERVQMMSKIYSRSWSVISWLVPASESTSRGMDLVQKLSTYYGDEKCTRELWKCLKSDNEYLGIGWSALYEIILREYWKRLWIIQGLAMGQLGGRFLCGSNYIY